MRSLFNSLFCGLSFAANYWILGHTSLSDQWAFGLALCFAIGGMCGSSAVVRKGGDGR